MRSIGEWKKLHNEELNYHQILFGCLNREVGNGRGRRTYGEMTGFWWGNLTDRVDGMIVLRWIFKKWDGAWTGLIWLRMEASGGYVWMR
jgi:hypothetical protein